MKARARKWIGPITVGLVAMASVAFTNAVAGAADSQPHLVGGDWQVDFRTVGSVGGVVIAGAVWITRKLTIIFTHMENTDERLRKIEGTLSDITKKLNR